MPAGLVNVAALFFRRFDRNGHVASNRRMVGALHDRGDGPKPSAIAAWPQAMA